MSTGTPTVAELVERYAPRLSPRGTSARSASVARRHLVGIGARVAASLGVHPDELTIAHLSPAELRAAFRGWSMDRGPVSLRRSWRTWQRFLDVLVADGVVDRNPLDPPRLDGEDPGNEGVGTSDVGAIDVVGVIDLVDPPGRTRANGSVVAVGSGREPVGLTRSVAAHPAHAALRRHGIFVPA